MNKIIALLIALNMLTAPAIADTIYMWTDENGVKRFSDQPPEGVETYETEESVPSTGDGETRDDFERMVEEVKRENRQADIRREKEAARQKAEEARKAKEKRDARIQAERDRLQEKIDELNNRALSPTFTQGMRDHQIQKIREQIDALE